MKRVLFGYLCPSIVHYIEVIPFLANTQNNIPLHFSYLNVLSGTSNPIFMGVYLNKFALFQIICKSYTEIS